MQAAQRSVTSHDFINQLNFEYLEIYSMLRSAEYLSQQQEYLKLDSQKKKNQDWTDEKQVRHDVLYGIFGSVQYIMDAQGNLHSSAVKTHIVQSDDPVADIIRDILRVEVKNMQTWVCTPEYRDAFVFYNKDGQVVNTLNICLSCELMALDPFTVVHADIETYHLLRLFLNDIGQEIEEE